MPKAKPLELQDFGWGWYLVPLTHGKWATVDAADAEFVAKHRWCAVERGATRPYVGRYVGKKFIRMAADFFGSDVTVRHLNGDWTDFRRENLSLGRETRAAYSVGARLAHVPLTQDRVAVIDEASIPAVSGRNWSAHFEDGNWYAVASGGVRMHRLIMGDPSDLVDHIDGDGLNNRLSNLRVADKSKNACNSKMRDDNVSGARGVMWDKARSRWRAFITIDDKQRYLGRHHTFEEAVAAWERGSEKYHGEFARKS